MRTCLVISAVTHLAIMLWVIFATDLRPFDPAQAEPVLVDLISPQDVPYQAQPPNFEPPNFELPKPAPSKLDPLKSALEARQRSAPKGKALATDSLDDQAATAARLAWMLDLPLGSSTSIAGVPSEIRSSLSNDEVAGFKARVSRCFVPPSGIPNAPELEVVIRVALNPDGTLDAEPQLIQGPASLQGPPLMESAKQALRQCQPYDLLPRDKYKDWKILDLRFTAEGPSGLAGRAAHMTSSPR